MSPEQATEELHAMMAARARCQECGFTRDACEGFALDRGHACCPDCSHGTQHVVHE